LSGRAWLLEPRRRRSGIFFARAAPNRRRALFLDFVFLLRSFMSEHASACRFMGLSSYRAFRLLIVLLFSLAALGLDVARAPASTMADEQVCDPLADYYLGMEDYPAAIRRHMVVIREHPDNALAHYHLGFAYGVTGLHQRELAEYRQAVRLGLSDWQLFLNMGLAYIEAGRLAEATEVLRLASLLAPYQSETHFNLGLAYERRGMLAPAEQEMLLALRLNSAEADIRNTLGLIYAEERRYALARAEWSELLSADPDYTPARENLAILEQAEQRGANGKVAGSHRVADFAHRR
jgi:Flp pilus assembly protein TadD